jgi:streptogramin lyase
VVALAVGITFTVVTLTRGPGPVVPTVNTAALFDPAKGDFTKAVPVGQDPSGVAVGEGSVWVISQADDTVQRIDPAATDPVIATKSTGGSPTGIAAGEGAAWITTGFGTAGLGESSLYEYVLANNSVEPQVTLPAGTGAVVAGDGSVWIASGNQNKVLRVDPKTHEKRAITVAEDPNNLALGAGPTNGVWVSSGIGQAVSWIRLEGAKMSVRTFDVKVDLTDLAVDKQWVWAVSNQNDELLQIDPKEGKVVKSISVPDAPQAVAETDGRVWVASYGARTLSAVNPNTGRIVERVPLKASPADLATDTSGNIWLVLRAQ